MQEFIAIAALSKRHSHSTADMPRLPVQGAAHVTRQVLATDGIRGLYRGYGIVVVGVIPARGVSPGGINCMRHSSVPMKRPCSPQQRLQ